MWFILLLAVLQSNPSVEESPLKCNSVWNKILQTGSVGNAESGSKQALRDAILHGAELQIYIPAWEYSTRTQQVSILRNNSEICAQALFHISKDSWKTFSPNALWYVLLICTTGHIEKSYWFAGSNTKLSPLQLPPSSTNRQRVMWFVRSDKARAVYCNSDTGLTTCGNLQDLKYAILTGADIRVVNQGSQPFTAVFNNDPKSPVVGWLLWSLGTEESSDHQTFKNQAFWRETQYTTNGSLRTTQWIAGSSRILDNSTNVPLKWFADTCWSSAYQHDNTGSPLDGSLQFLRSAIKVGHRVRVAIGDISLISEADNIVVQSSGISAQVSGLFSTGSTISFITAHFSTSGNGELMLHDLIGSNGNSVKFPFTAIWYIDSRHWKHVLKTSETGLATFGSKSNVIQYIQMGWMLRCVINFAPDHILAAQADNIEISPDGTNIGAQILHIISYTVNGTSTRHLENIPFWRFTIATTEGTVSQSEWMVGNHTSRNTNSTHAEIDWFVG